MASGFHSCMCIIYEREKDTKRECVRDIGVQEGVLGVFMGEGGEP